MLARLSACWSGCYHFFGFSTDEHVARINEIHAKLSARLEAKTRELEEVSRSIVRDNSDPALTAYTRAIRLQNLANEAVALESEIAKLRQKVVKAAQWRRFVDTAEEHKDIQIASENFAYFMKKKGHNVRRVVDAVETAQDIGEDADDAAEELASMLDTPESSQATSAKEMLDRILGVKNLPPNGGVAQVQKGEAESRAVKVEETGEEEEEQPALDRSRMRRMVDA